MAEMPEYLAYAATLQIVAPSPIADERWQKALGDFFTRLGEVYKKQDGVTIGHIKGFLRLANGGCAYLSTVGSAAGASCRLVAAGEAWQEISGLNPDQMDLFSPHDHGQQPVKSSEVEPGSDMPGETGQTAAEEDEAVRGMVDFNVILFGIEEVNLLALLRPEILRLAEDLGAEIQLIKAPPKTKGGFKKKK